MMNRLDSDFLGIFLAILTFVLPAVSALFEKRRKDRRRKGEHSAHVESFDLYPDNDSSIMPEEKDVYADGKEKVSAAGQEYGVQRQMQQEDERAKEIEELFEVLLGVRKKVVEEPPVVQEMEKFEEQEFEIPEPESGVMETSGAQWLEEQRGLEEELLEEAVPAVEPALIQQSGVEPETGVPLPGKSLKERLKEHPEDMVLFAEIMKPKFKEF